MLRWWCRSRSGYVGAGVISGGHRGGVGASEGGGSGGTCAEGCVGIVVA